MVEVDLAVLRLDNHSGDPKQNHFAVEGMTDELTADLATIRQVCRQFARIRDAVQRGSQ